MGVIPPCFTGSLADQSQQVPTQHETSRQRDNHQRDIIELTASVRSAV
jgi:hypothetical protein